MGLGGSPAGNYRSSASPVQVHSASPDPTSRVLAHILTDDTRRLARDIG